MDTLGRIVNFRDVGPPTPEEIRLAIRECLPTSDEYLFSECAHAIGHLARRFGAVDEDLLKQFYLEVFRFAGSEHVRRAIVDMKDDISHFG